MKEGKTLKIIEWKDMDKTKFYRNGLILSGLLRFTIYPTNLVKTRLQAQEGKAYKGLFDAFKQIAAKEGIRGFYKGFPISLLQVLAGQLYITTYESSKQYLFHNQPLSIQHLLGGFMASTVSQTIMVPVDVISQHQQVFGAEQKMSPVNLKSPNHHINTAKRTTYKRNIIGQSIRISSQILKNEGIPGIYRGYTISLLTYGSNSALYWAFYYLYSELIEDLLPKTDHVVREPFRIITAGLFGAISGVILTNPFDVIRTRYQLQGNSSTNTGAWRTFINLMQTEGWKGLTRGLTARLTSASINSVFLILGYEYLKKFSVKDNMEQENDFLKDRYERKVLPLLDPSILSSEK